MPTRDPDELETTANAAADHVTSAVHPISDTAELDIAEEDAQDEVNTPRLRQDDSFANVAAAESVRAAEKAEKDATSEPREVAQPAAESESAAEAAEVNATSEPREAAQPAAESESPAEAAEANAASEPREASQPAATTEPALPRLQRPASVVESEIDVAEEDGLDEVNTPRLRERDSSAGSVLVLSGQANGDGPAEEEEDAAKAESEGGKGLENGDLAEPHESVPEGDGIAPAAAVPAAAENGHTSLSSEESKGPEAAQATEAVAPAEEAVESKADEPESQQQPAAGEELGSVTEVWVGWGDCEGYSAAWQTLLQAIYTGVSSGPALTLPISNPRILTLLQEQVWARLPAPLPALTADSRPAPGAPLTLQERRVEKAVGLAAVLLEDST